MTGVEMDTVRRAFSDLQASASAYEMEKEDQRIRDIEREIASREAEVDRLMALRDDALEASKLVRPVNPALAFAFNQRAGILLEEAERHRPHALRKKLNDALQDREDIRSIASVLTTVGDLEFLNGE